MTQISRYIIDTKVTGSDKWIGSDSETQNTTKNFTPNKLSVYFNENQVIDIGTPIRYRYDILEPLDDRLRGTITFDPQVGTPYNFSSITNFILSKYTLKENNVSEYLNFLVGKKILICKADDVNIFGYYQLTSLVENLLEPNFFDVTVSYITGNGSIVEDKDYLISLIDGTSPNIPTRTSDLINDGEDGVHPFITLQDISGFVPYTGATSDINIGTHKITADDGTTNSEMSPSLFGVENNSGNTYGLLEYNQLTMLDPSGSIGITASGITFPNASLQTTAFPPTGGTSLQYIKGDGTLATFPSISIPTLDQVLTSGNASLLDAKIGDLYLYDQAFSIYGSINLDAEEFIFKTTPTDTVARITYGSTQLSGIGYSLELSYTGLTANRVYTMPNASGTIALTSNLSGYVPYTGATGAVDLGAYNLTVNNISIGKGSGTGTFNTVIGQSALSSNTTGSSNIAIGYLALTTNIIGSNNIAIGYKALSTASYSNRNTAIGWSSGEFITTGSENTFLGWYSGNGTTTGYNNTYVGHQAGAFNTTGTNNTLIGYYASRLSTTALQNSSLGAYSLNMNTAGSYNSVFGYNALQYTTTGSSNVAIGWNAGSTQTGGGGISNNPSNSIYIGYDTKSPLNNQTNQIVIGYGAVGAGSNTVTLGNTSITTTRLRGNVQGGAFVKDGGTSLEYLMADGSVSTGPSITPASLTKVDDTNVTLTLGGTPNTALLQGVSLTLGWTGTLSDARIASASNWNTAYTNRIVSLTTTGSSGSASLISNTLNIPTYTLSGLGGVPTSRTLTINGTAYDLTADRTWTISGGLPTGGTAGQILTKIDATDYNATWQDNYADWTSVVKHIVKNDGVALITKGTPVYVTGSNGTNMLVGKASNTSEATSSKTMGLMQSDITTTGSTQTGFVITEGLLSGLNTAGRTAGEPIWLGPSGTLIYGLINKPYAPAHLVFIGIVTKVSAGSGEVFVKVQNGFELKEIHDVDIITNTPINGDILGFDGTLWVNKTIAGWLGFTPVTNSTTISTTSPLQGGGDLTANRTLSILQSSSIQNGYLSSTDWSTFNNKQDTISLTTTGSSGASTFISNTLNVPTYTLSGLGGQPLATNLTSLSGLTYASTSFVKMTAAGTFALDTNTYQGAITLTTTGTSGAATLVGNTLNIPQYGGGGGSTPVKLTSQTLTAASWTLSGGYYTYSFSNVNVTTTCDVSVTPQNASYLTAYNAQVLPFVGVAAGVATFYAQFPPQANMTVDIVITQTT